MAEEYPLDQAADYPVDEIIAGWRRERPSAPVTSIGIVTPLWRLAKLFADDRRRVLAEAGVDGATLDLLGTLRRGGPPYTLSTHELAARSMVTAGAISQRVTRAEREQLVTRRPAGSGSRAVLVELTPAGHALVEATVDRVLGREAELVAGLDQQQRGQLSELLAVLLTDVRKRLL